MQKIRTLPQKQGWDGYNAKPISSDLSRLVYKWFSRHKDKLIASSDTLEMYCVPVGNGHIQLEFYFASRSLELEFTPYGSILFLKQEGEKYIDGSFSVFQEEKIGELFEWLTEPQC